MMFIYVALALLLASAVANAANCPADKAAAQEVCAGKRGCFIPRCVNLSYAPVQCHGSGCFCVDTEGKRLNYHWSIGEERSDCECARLEAEGGLADANCASNGGFL